MAKQNNSSDYFVPDFTEKGEDGKKRVKNWPRSTRIIWTITFAVALVLVIVVFSLDDGRSSQQTVVRTAPPEVRDVTPATGFYSDADALREIMYRNLRDQITAEVAESMRTEQRVGPAAVVEPERTQPRISAPHTVRRPPSPAFQAAQEMKMAAFTSPANVDLGVNGSSDEATVDDIFAVPGAETLTRLMDTLNNINVMDTDMQDVDAVLGAGVMGLTMPRDATPDRNATGMAHQGRLNAFVSANTNIRGGSVEDEYISSSRRAPLSPYELKAGSIISGVMVGGINSDLPGTILGQVTENVYDTATGRHLLIPQGSRMVGTYDSHVVYGQNRLLVVWNRIIFPDGTSLNLEGMTGSDPRGYAGFRQRIDRHYGRMIGAAIFSSVFVAAARAATESDRGRDQYGNESFRSIYAETVMQNVSDVATRIIDQNLNIAPTLRILPGYRFIIVTTKDVNFAEPYVVPNRRS